MPEVKKHTRKIGNKTISIDPFIRMPSRRPENADTIDIERKIVLLKRDIQSLESLIRRYEDLGFAEKAANLQAEIHNKLHKISKLEEAIREKISKKNTSILVGVIE